MGTSAGFFGITYQGATNGLASQTLSVFNVVCTASQPRHTFSPQETYSYIHAWFAHPSYGLACAHNYAGPSR